MVWKPLETWPDRLDATLQEAACLYAENRCPHGCDKRPQANCWIGAVHPENRADDDGKRDAILSAHLACESDDHAADREPEEHNRDRFSGCEAQRHDR